MDQTQQSTRQPDLARLFRSFDTVVCLLLVVTAMKLVGFFGPQLPPNSDYLRFDVMVVSLIAGLGAMQHGWRWVFWIAFAVFAVSTPWTFSRIPPQVWQPLDFYLGVIILIGATAWVIAARKESKRPQGSL
jgi:MFS family permease